MKKVLKFALQHDALTTVQLPVNAEILSVIVQPQGPVLYALVDMAAPKVTRQFVAAPTGALIPDEVKLAFVGTYMGQTGSGVIVSHVFEVLGGAPAVASLPPAGSLLN